MTKETRKLLPFYSRRNFNLVIRSLCSLIACCVVLKSFDSSVNICILYRAKKGLFTKSMLCYNTACSAWSCEKQNKETTNYYECNKQIEKNNVNTSFDTCKPSVITRNRGIVTTTVETEGERKRYGHGGCTKPDKSAQQEKETTSEREREKRKRWRKMWVCLKNVCVFPEWIWNNSEAPKQLILPSHKRGVTLI